MLASPGLPSFDYVRPGSSKEAAKILHDAEGKARLLMGGTDVFVRMRDGFYAPKYLVDVKHLPGMQEVELRPRKGLKIGAAVNMNALARHPAVQETCPLLVEALESVASYQLRSRATMGGNLCNASPAADTAPAALVLEATLHIHGPDEEREVPISTFFKGPGRSVLAKDELLHHIEIPTLPKDAVGRYFKLGRNARGDLALMGLAVLAYPDADARSGYTFRLALASVAPTPVRVPAAELILSTNPLNAETFEAAAMAAMETARPIDDVRSSAEYRREMVGSFTRKALAAVWESLQSTQTGQGSWR